VEIIILLVVAGGLFLLLKSGRSGRGARSSRAEPQQRPKVAHPPIDKFAKAQPSAFDEYGAEHLDEKRVLTGAAYITDGDTITIKQTQIRLFGVDAPELNHPYGKKAKWALHKLCKGQVVRAEITDVDHHGRTVAQCFLPDGRDLSAEMVKQGLAIDWPKLSAGKYREMETHDARKRLFLADARQKGRMHVWEKFEARQAAKR